MREAASRTGDPAAAGTILVRGRGLVFDYPGPLRALDGADLELGAGELLVVIGPNGSGKSTLVKVLAGLCTPLAGAVTLRGEDGGDVALGTLAPAERARRIALVPQFLPVLPDVLVADFVAGGRYAHRASAPRAGSERWLGLAPRPEDRDAVRAALAACDADDLACRALTELSGGQRQRVLVARAVAQDSDVLFVDEPTNALDPDHQLRVFDVLARHTAPPRAACVVTHDLNLASQYATRVALMDRGRVVAHGTPREILRPDVLGPVYGERLVFGEWPAGTLARGPFVLPRREA